MLELSMKHHILDEEGNNPAAAAWEPCVIVIIFESWWAALEYELTALADVGWIPP